MRQSDIIARSFATQLFAWDEETRGAEWFSVMLDVAERRGLEAALELVPADFGTETKEVESWLVDGSKLPNLSNGRVTKVATVYRLEDAWRSPRVVCIGQEARQRDIGAGPLPFGAWTITDFLSAGFGSTSSRINGAEGLTLHSMYEVAEGQQIEVGSMVALDDHHRAFHTGNADESIGRVVSREVDPESPVIEWVHVKHPTR